MPRQKSLITIIRDLVRTEIQKAMSSLLGGLGVGQKTAKPKRRRRRRRRSAAAATSGTKKRGRPRGSTRRRRTSAAPAA
jgi:hypothetical protein